jgi:hypothetical protein
MAIGVYGSIRGADVDINDIDIYYNYTPDRQTSNDIIIKVANAGDLLSYVNLPDDDPNYIAVTDPTLDKNSNILEGLYNLRLPASIFNQLGIYTIYIKPKIIMSTIIDCSVLSALPTVKGIVIDVNTLTDEKLRANNALQGFKVEYINTDGTKMKNVVRYVVSSNKVVPVSENVGNTSQKAIRYRFDDAGSLMFLQLTPSSSSDVKPNIIPFIGNPAGIILLSNTYFSPLVLEVEFVENTIQTLADIVAGEQLKDVNNGILTYYDKNRLITKQFNLYEVKASINDAKPLYEVKEKRISIDETQTIDNANQGT